MKVVYSAEGTFTFMKFNYTNREDKQCMQLIKLLAKLNKLTTLCVSMDLPTPSEQFL